MCLKCFNRPNMRWDDLVSPVIQIFLIPDKGQILLTGFCNCQKSDRKISTSEQIENISFHFKILQSKLDGHATGFISVLLTLSSTTSGIKPRNFHSCTEYPRD